MEIFAIWREGNKEKCSFRIGHVIGLAFLMQLLDWNYALFSSKQSIHSCIRNSPSTEWSLINIIIFDVLFTERTVLKLLVAFSMSNNRSRFIYIHINQKGVFNYIVNTKLRTWYMNTVVFLRRSRILTAAQSDQKKIEDWLLWSAVAHESLCIWRQVEAHRLST